MTAYLAETQDGQLAVYIVELRQPIPVFNRTDFICAVALSNAFDLGNFLDHSYACYNCFQDTRAILWAEAWIFAYALLLSGWK